MPTGTIRRVDGVDAAAGGTLEPSVPPGWPTDDELPVRGWGDVDLDLDELWATFLDVAGWPRWNPCISWSRVLGGELREGARLVWVFRPIRRWMPYRMPAIATIVEVVPRHRVTWEVRLPGFHALHSYLFAPGAAGQARFGSWEIAEGPGYRALRRFWLAHFRFVRDRSIEGAASLGPERAVRLIEHGAEHVDTLPIVVVPGIDGQPGSVAPIVDRLARHRRVLLVDYSREIEPTLDDLADAIAELLPDRCDLVGQSIGTWLAAHVARRRPDAVRKVVLIATFTRVRGLAVRASAAMTRLMPRWLYRRTTPALMRLACGPVGDGGDHPFLRGVAASDQEGVARRSRWQVGHDARQLLAGVDQPVAVLVGNADRFVPRRRREFARLESIFSRRGDRFETIDGAGHVLLPSAAVETATLRIEEHLR